VPLVVRCRSSQELQHAVQQVVDGVAQSELLLDDVTPGLLQQVGGIVCTSGLYHRWRHSKVFV
jgi:hypothetical protein